MANDFIHVIRNNSNATHFSLVLQIVSQVTTLRDSVNRAVGIARHNFDDQVSPKDFSQFEALFGIPEGKGQAMFTLLDGLRGSLTGEFQTNAGITLIESVG